tara:strand:+ start:344 stop:781 length:438 start_codon:yes stop_codon:yes gene_type:complete
MATSKKEYLAWINGGMMGTRWRANTIKDAVETCVVIATQDWGGLRGTEVPVGVYDVTEHASVLLAGHTGKVIPDEEPETEIPLLYLVKVDVPKLRKNGSAYSKHYQSKVRKAAYTALRRALWKSREERVEAAIKEDPMMQELLAE